MKNSTMTRAQAASLLAGGFAAAVATPALAQSVIATPVPITGNDVFSILHNDHVRIKALLDRLVADTGNRHDTLLELGTIFTVHNATEENLVYPAIAAIAKETQGAAELYHEQDEAKMIMWGLTYAHSLGQGKSTEFDAHARKLRAAALDHVALEEDTEFPKLRSALGSAGVAKLTKDVRMFRQRFA